MGAHREESGMPPKPVPAVPWWVALLFADVNRMGVEVCVTYSSSLQPGSLSHDLEEKLSRKHSHMQVRGSGDQILST